MQGLTLVIASADPVRFHAALSLAAAHAALERPTRVFLQADAVALLRPPVGCAEDERYSAAGMPTLSQLLGEALGMGVAVTACQSGLALAGMDAGELPPGLETGGLVGLVSAAGEDRLLFV